MSSSLWICLYHKSECSNNKTVIPKLTCARDRIPLSDPEQALVDQIYLFGYQTYEPQNQLVKATMLMFTTTVDITTLTFKNNNNNKIKIGTTLIITDYNTVVIIITFNTYADLAW